MAELVDAPDLGSGAERRKSSSLFIRTIKYFGNKELLRYCDEFVTIPFLHLVTCINDCFGSRFVLSLGTFIYWSLYIQMQLKNTQYIFYYF